MKIYFLIITLLILTGCSTTPVSYSEAAAVPANRLGIAYQKFAAEDPSTANVIILRDSGFQASLIPFHIYIDGEKVASIKIKESLSLLLTPGEHFLGIVGAGHLSETAERDGLDEQVLNVKDGETYYYRVGILQNKGLILQRSSQLK